MSVNSKMTALADEIRELSGTEEAMGLDAMKIHVGEANTDVATEADLIAQITSVLQNKSIDVEYKEVEYSENENAIISRTVSNYTNGTVTSIGNYAFYGFMKLKSVNFPVCTKIGTQAFYICSNLTSVNFPACTSIGKYAFSNCSSLTSVSFPACTHIGSGAFYNCSKLTTVSFPACTNIGSSSAFGKCYNLSQLYLTGSSLCTLSNSNAFYSTPYAGYSASFSGTPYIYVQASLVNAYKTATNWAYFSSYIKAIENGGGYSGGSD